ncbi:tRNA (adenosine(37)-N6)-threonylcarbamoyltransferase complex dimerization subunit type 1 TsaB [Patulibacter sp. NPDC049589]|uniref:tRNA (adenosine(37)-N6)-threonylcarbamoyltransferase complex dimerization subunit type 1 TsaB n=1 Tax=Patulibacter sp. NPDC049589 TaxID=3154731 RepID=UPI00342F4ED9
MTAADAAPATDPTATAAAASGAGPTAGGWTLGLDTATPATVAGAAGPGDAPATAARIAIPAAGERPGHTRLLLGLADEVLRETGATWPDVTRIVLGLGPGTFTGIRVGVATGRALALAHGTDLVGVPTPAALAEAAAGPGGRHAGRSVLVVQDARRRELFLTSFAAGAPVAGPDAALPWTVAQDGLAAALDALPELPFVAVGDGAVAFADVLRAAGVVVPDDPAAHAVDGLALIRAAAAMPVAAPDLVRPLYVRDADAVPTAERR